MPDSPATALPGCDAQASWKPHGTYSLRQSLGILQRSAGDPTAKVTDPAAWLCFHTPLGPVTLLARHPAGHNTEVFLQAWGPGAEHAVERGRHLLGA